MYTNNEPTVLVSPVFWYSQYSHFFSKTFFTGIANLQESGISSHHKTNRMVIKQKHVLEQYRFKIKCGNMKS